jgi:AcrR family transcriptional regulator
MVSNHSVTFEMTTHAQSRRLTAEERRESIVRAAVSEFAAAGLAGASTEAIARRAGISHAYLFRLFGTKRELFLATVEHAYDRILETFRRAEREREEGVPVVAALGKAYRQLLDDREELVFQLHAYSASGDEDIREAVRRRYTEVMRYVERVAGFDDDQTRLFMAVGALMNIGVALDVAELSPDDGWPARLTRMGRLEE